MGLGYICVPHGISKEGASGQGPCPLALPRMAHEWHCSPRSSAAWKFQPATPHHAPDNYNKWQHLRARSPEVSGVLILTSPQLAAICCHKVSAAGASQRRGGVSPPSPP